MSPRIVAIRKDSDIGSLFWKKRPQPTYTIGSRKCILPVAIQAMDCDDTVWKRPLARGHPLITPVVAYSILAALQL